MRDLVGLSARRLEEDRGTDAPGDVAQRALGIGVERAAVRLLAGDVGVDRRDEARLAELAQHHASKAGLRQRSRPNSEKWLGTRLTERVLCGNGDPLSQHGQRTACLLILWQRLPFSLEDRERCRVEWVACLETLL